jgi:hypothetical protein
MFLLDPSRENVFGFEGVFYGFVLWEMNFLELLHTFYGNILMGRQLPTTFCTIYYGLQRMKEEQGSLIKQEKFMVAAAIEPLSSS